MIVRIIFRCSRCGSTSFRPSTKWRFKDTIFRKIGVTPQRCYLCRRRFYIFRPILLQSLLRALAAPPIEVHEPTVVLHPKIARKPLTESRSQTARENLAG